MESICCCGAEYLGRGWCVAGAACPRQVIGRGSWSVTADEVRRDPRWVSAFPDLDLGRIGLRRLAPSNRRCYCGALGYGAGECDAGGACPRQLVGGGSWARTAKVLRRNPTWVADFPNLNLKALGLQGLPDTERLQDQCALADAGTRPEAEGDAVAVGDQAGAGSRTELYMPEFIWLRDERKPGRFAVSETTRDGMTLCPSFNLGVCDGQPVRRTKRNKDRVAEGCALGVHMCAITLRSGRVCGMPNHGASTCRMLKRAIRLDSYPDELGAVSAQRGTEIGTGGREWVEQESVSLWDMMVETDSEDERDFLSGTRSVASEQALRADGDAESIPPMPTRPTPREVEPPFFLPSPPPPRKLPRSVPGPPAPQETVVPENLEAGGVDPSQSTADELCRSLGTRQRCVVGTDSAHVVFARNERPGREPWVWFALQAPRLSMSDGSVVWQDAHVTLYYGTGSAVEQAEEIVEAMDREVDRWKASCGAGLAATLWFDPAKEHLMRPDYAWMEVICGPGFYERLHQLSHVGRSAHRGPWADLRPRSCFHLSIRTRPRRPEGEEAG